MRNNKTIMTTIKQNKNKENFNNNIINLVLKLVEFRIISHQYHTILVDQHS
jgi:hypothetical protein